MPPCQLKTELPLMVTATSPGTLVSNTKPNGRVDWKIKLPAVTPDFEPPYVYMTCRPFKRSTGLILMTTGAVIDQIAAHRNQVIRAAPFEDIGAAIDGQIISDSQGAA